MTNPYKPLSEEWWKYIANQAVQTASPAVGVAESVSNAPTSIINQAAQQVTGNLQPYLTQIETDAKAAGIWIAANIGLILVIGVGIWIAFREEITTAATDTAKVAAVA